jgi:tetratricopeptide (TPR) repeat protein
MLLRSAAVVVAVLIVAQLTFAPSSARSPHRSPTSKLVLAGGTALARDVSSHAEEAPVGGRAPSLGDFILAILLRLVGFFFTTWIGLFVLVGVIVPSLSAWGYSWGKGRSRAGYLRLKLVNPIDTAARYELALAWIDARRYRAAERVLKEALAVRDDEARVHFAYARVLFHLRRYEDAMAQARRSAEIDENFGYGDVDVLVGNSLLSLNRPKEALAAYEKALSRNTSNVQAQFKAAVAASRIGDRGAVKKYLGDIHQAFMYLPPYARRRSWVWWTLAALFPISRRFF